LCLAPDVGDLGQRESELHDVFFGANTVEQRQVRAERDRNIAAVLQLPLRDDAEPRRELFLGDLSKPRDRVGRQAIHANRLPQLAAVAVG
jgi:hypothetical protein